MIAILAYVLHTQPSEVDAMTVSDLHDWMKRAVWITEKTRVR